MGDSQTGPRHLDISGWYPGVPWLESGPCHSSMIMTIDTVPVTESVHAQSLFACEPIPSVELATHLRWV